MIAPILDFAAWAFDYVGLAALWGALIGGALALPLLAVWPRAAPLAPACAFVVCLALLPLPDPATFDCATDGGRIVLEPFRSLWGTFRWVWRTGEYWRLLVDLTFVSSVMNVVFFMLPGAALARLTGLARIAAGFGLALSLAIEGTQLTGNLGLYDCMYRHPDVTDLMTNTAGVLLGFLLARRWQRRRAV